MSKAIKKKFNRGFWVSTRTFPFSKKVAVGTEVHLGVKDGSIYLDTSKNSVHTDKVKLTRYLSVDLTPSIVEKAGIKAGQYYMVTKNEEQSLILKPINETGKLRKLVGKSAEQMAPVA